MGREGAGDLLEIQTKLLRGTALAPATVLLDHRALVRQPPPLFRRLLRLWCAIVHDQRRGQSNQLNAEAN